MVVILDFLALCECKCFWFTFNALFFIKLLEYCCLLPPGRGTWQCFHVHITPILRPLGQYLSTPPLSPFQPWDIRQNITEKDRNMTIRILLHRGHVPWLFLALSSSTMYYGGMQRASGTTFQSLDLINRKSTIPYIFINKLYPKNLHLRVLNE